MARPDRSSSINRDPRWNENPPGNLRFAALPLMLLCIAAPASAQVRWFGGRPDPIQLRQQQNEAIHGYYYNHLGLRSHEEVRIYQEAEAAITRPWRRETVLAPEDEPSGPMPQDEVLERLAMKRVLAFRAGWRPPSATSAAPPRLQTLPYVGLGLVLREATGWTKGEWGTALQGLGFDAAGLRDKPVSDRLTRGFKKQLFANLLKDVGNQAGKFLKQLPRGRGRFDPTNDVRVIAVGPTLRLARSLEQPGQPPAAREQLGQIIQNLEQLDRSPMNAASRVEIRNQVVRLVRDLKRLGPMVTALDGAAFASRIFPAIESYAVNRESYGEHLDGFINTHQGVTLKSYATLLTRQQRLPTSKNRITGAFDRSAYSHGKQLPVLRSTQTLFGTPEGRGMMTRYARTPSIQKSGFLVPTRFLPTQR